jgi:predicted RNA binding protein YcfA (HicA-like mRNA interferase family)
MSKREKRLEKIRQNPKDVSFEELRQVLEDHGFTLESVAGSHHNFKRRVKTETFKITIPYHKPIKSFYVKQAIKAIDAILALESNEE